MVRELAEDWRQLKLHVVPEMPRTLSREPRAQEVRTVTVHLPHPSEVREAIFNALEDERRQNRRPRVVLVGMSWWLSLDQAYTQGGLPPWLLEGVDMRLDGTMPRGCRVICNTAAEMTRFARESAKPAPKREG